MNDEAATSVPMFSTTNHIIWRKASLSIGQSFHSINDSAIQRMTFLIGALFLQADLAGRIQVIGDQNLVICVFFFL
jgi:hypothetical protein